MAKKNDVAGHAWGGFEARYPAFDRATAFGVCECGRRFDARTTARKRALHADHAREVRAARELRADFSVVLEWARRDQQECFSLESTPAGKTEVAKNINMIERVEKAVDALLAREAR